MGVTGWRPVHDVSRLRILVAEMCSSNLAALVGQEIPGSSKTPLLGQNCWSIHWKRHMHKAKSLIGRYSNLANVEIF